MPDLRQKFHHRRLKRIAPGDRDADLIRASFIRRPLGPGDRALQFMQIPALHYYRHPALRVSLELRQLLLNSTLVAHPLLRGVVKLFDKWTRRRRRLFRNKQFDFRNSNSGTAR